MRMIKKAEKLLLQLLVPGRSLLLKKLIDAVGLENLGVNKATLNGKNLLCKSNFIRNYAGAILFLKVIFLNEQNIPVLGNCISKRKRKNSKKEKESFHTGGVAFKARRNGINESVVCEDLRLCRKFLDLKMKGIVPADYLCIFFFE